jgi:hypothetical protein
VLLAVGERGANLLLAYTREALIEHRQLTREIVGAAQGLKELPGVCGSRRQGA